MYYAIHKYAIQKDKIFFQTKNINCGAKVHSTKRQSAGHILRGHSWRHINRLSPLLASIFYGFGCSVKNSEISSDCCVAGATVNINVYIDEILAPALRDMKEHFKNGDFTFQEEGALSHISNKTQVWGRENYPRF